MLMTSDMLQIILFIQKYSTLFDLGRVFEWKKHNKFKAWLTNILNTRPKFILPFYRLANNLFTPCNLHQHIGKITVLPNIFINHCNTLPIN
ncbi:hypothetical protein RHMOL_Rhmol11G0058900 [Rhododendron molle]|uniref:Uncharacterized protein n=1 Tax=Rhododendron molle TaxID=49168 RepID=A0ACC0LPX7_RHOML|nr:hypothetical protein RHMOL_Rhmol11G0058900 [Rhododendron molle]